MEIAARDTTIDKANREAMVAGNRHLTGEQYALHKMKSDLWTEWSQMDYQRSVLKAELKAPCASGTTLSQRESPPLCDAFEH